MANILAAARAYLCLGFCPIPIRGDGSKAPTIEWKVRQQALPTHEQLVRDFTPPNIGVGLVCGRVAGNFEVIDFDVEGWCDSFEQLAADFGHEDLIRTLVRVKTPAGDQFYYRCESPVDGSQKLANHLIAIPPDSDIVIKGKRQYVVLSRKEYPVVEVHEVKYALATGIETRGEGGYVVAPPSGPQCHPDNKPYKFVRGKPKDVPVISETNRTFLLNLARSFTEYLEPEQSIDAQTTLRKEGDFRPGDDYNSRGDYLTLIQAHGWSLNRERSGIGYWRHPGKTGPGHSATTGYGGQRLLYCFTPNAAPFEQNRAYTPFVVYSLLEHDGDFAAAASALAKQGYGGGQFTQTTSFSPSPAQSSGEVTVNASRVRLRTLDEWANESGTEREFVWQDTISLRHIACLSAKQKVGKSTLIRNLIAAVIQGTPFLGRPVKQGKVVYLPLEEEAAEVYTHFRSMGVSQDLLREFLLIPTEDVVYSFTDIDGRTVTSVETRIIRDVQQLEAAIQSAKPVLVVIDPIVQFIKFTDMNAYDKTYADLTPLMRLARLYTCGILFTTHEGKTDRENVGQRSIGSTAFPAIVSATLSMQSKGGTRTLESEGRGGVVRFEKLVITMDATSGIVSAAGSYEEMQTTSFCGAIMEIVNGFTEPFTRDTLMESVEGRQQTKFAAWKELVTSGRIVHVSGVGKKGDPKLYISGSLVPVLTVEPSEPEFQAETECLQIAGSQVPTHISEPAFAPSQNGLTEKSISAPQEDILAEVIRVFDGTLLPDED